MRTQNGDLFNPPVGTVAICITTNGDIRKDGKAVMGRGVALEAAKRWPMLPHILSIFLASVGNLVHVLHISPQFRILSFPTKHSWRNPSNIELIKLSAQQLVVMTDMNGWKQVCLPPPGCGNGGLRWKDVEAVLRDILDDRFIVLFKEE